MTPKIRALTKASSVVVMAASLLAAGQVFAAEAAATPALTKNQEEGKNYRLHQKHWELLGLPPNR